MVNSHAGEYNKMFCLKDVVREKTVTLEMSPETAVRVSECDPFRYASNQRSISYNKQHIESNILASFNIRMG
jgi:hypothetical protein